MLVLEDIIFHIDYLTISDRIGYLPFFFYYYRVNENSLTKTYTVEKVEKIKILLLEVKHKLANHYEGKRFSIHYKRFMLLYYRFILTWCSESLRQKRFSNKQKLKALINDDIFWQELFVDYPFWKLPIKHMLFYIMCKYRLSKFFLVYILMPLKTLTQ